MKLKNENEIMRERNSFEVFCFENMKKVKMCTVSGVANTVFKYFLVLYKISQYRIFRNFGEIRATISSPIRIEIFSNFVIIALVLFCLPYLVFKVFYHVFA